MCYTRLDLPYTPSINVTTELMFKDELGLLLNTELSHTFDITVTLTSVLFDC